MTLEDFFTLSELNNGLTTPSRVTELVAIMEKEIDSSCKNAGYLTRQWSTVARAITATDNKDCLDLFVQLDGLNFIAKLLKNAQRLVTEENDNTSIEDTITNLLQAVETFQLDRGKLLDSEIWVTVKDLLVHSSPKVHGKARVLFENWENNRVIGDLSVLDKERPSALTDDVQGEYQDATLGNTDLSEETPAEEEKAHELTRDEISISTSAGTVEDNVDVLGNNSDNKLDPIETEKTVVELCSPTVSKIKELTSHEEPSPSEGTHETESSKILCDEGSPIGGVTTDTAVKVPGDAKECMFPNTANGENRLEDMKEVRKYRTGIEADVKVKRRELLTSGCDLASSYGLGKKPTADKETADKSCKRSDNDFDYGIVDALDIARQVAIEVEREVGEYREQSLNSPENNTQQPPDGSESVSHGEFRVSGDDSSDHSNTDSDNDSKTHEETVSENPDAEQINEGATTTETNSQKILCGFDLNQVSSEDVENPTNYGSLPGAPLQSDGNLGWKSSASSVFQPASPRRIPEKEKQIRVGESSGSKKHESFLGFDLNVAEDLDPSHTHHHGESHAETSSRKTEGMFSLDLNHTSEPDNGGPRDWLASRNFLTSQTVQQHTPMEPIRFPDLNDQPSLLKSSSEKSNFSSRLPPTFDAFGASKLKETEFSLFGARVEIKAKDNFRAQELAFNSYNVRPMQSFFGMGPPPMVHYTTDPPVYGYNNNVQLSGPTVPLPSAIYGPGGPIPYMVDARGAPVVPQIMGSGLPFSIPFSQPPPFVFNPPPSNGAKSGFDLNSGTVMAESGGSSSSSIKDNSSFGQFLNLGQFRSMEEHTRPNVVGQKRKEPENGWENYGLRPYTPPWK